MPVICPTVTAYGTHQYRAQIETIQLFAERVHIDLMDGAFAPTKSPSLEEIWLPEGIISDIHLMYQKPMDQLEQLIKMRPSLVVFHFEADVDHVTFAKQLKENNIKAGLAILQETDVEDVIPTLLYFDHALVFSGDLGHHGGEADLELVDKVRLIRQAYPEIEISWDGGINDQNARQLVEAGVDVLNTGGFIQQSQDPQSAYATLKSVIEG